MSVFQTPPPSFSNVEVEEILLSQFNIVGNAKSLVSDRDQNFFISANNSQKYVLKVSNTAEDWQILEMQNEATLHIKSNDPDIGVPLQVGEIKTIEKDGQKYFVRLLEYLEGQFLKDQNLDDDAFEKLGRFLARLNRALEGFSHRAADRKFHWDAQSVELIRSRLQYLENQSDQETVSHFLDIYESQVTPIEMHLRKMVIHNDGNDHNVLVNADGNTTGIIDFGDMVYSYQVAEPAVCMAYVGLGSADPIHSMGKVLKGYHENFPLNDFELRSAIYLMSIRLCISVTMAAWRMKLYPENKYLSISQVPAWALLRKLEKEDQESLSSKIVVTIN